MIKAVRADLERDPRIKLHEATRPLRLTLDERDGSLAISGEVADVIDKKLVLEHAIRHAGIDAIVDRLRVAPAEAMTDDEIADHLGDELAFDTSFRECILAVRGRVPLQAPDDENGTIILEIHQGVVLLDGEVPSLSHKRLAGVLAWWVPGSRDVINGLGVVPDQEDSDAEVVEALRLILEKDPYVDAVAITVTCTDLMVTLSGTVASEGERRMAIHDAWYTFGVDDVIDQLEVI